MAFFIAALMAMASIGAFVARPNAESTRLEPPILLESIIPKQFGEWREEPQQFTLVINPITQALLEETYTEILSRIYVNPEGYRVMLSLAYARDERGNLEAHKPEICYVANGFTLEKRETTRVSTLYGDISAQRLFTRKGQRVEPVTYWYKLGDIAISGNKQKFQRRLATLRYNFNGRVLDGLLFRVSSIDPDQKQANQIQDQFINHLLQSVPAPQRKRLSGLGESFEKQE